MGERIPSIIFLAAVAAVMVVFLLPHLARAAFGDGNKIYCTGIACPCDMGPGPDGRPCSKPTPRPAGGVVGCFCQEEANGKVSTGQCVAPLNCQATASEGLGGDMKGIMDAMKLLQELFKGKGGGGGGGGGGQPPPPTQPGQEYPPCVENPATKTKSPIPCKEANGMINFGDGQTLDLGLGGGLTGELSGLADTLLDALGGTLSGGGSDGGDTGGGDGGAEESGKGEGGASGEKGGSAGSGDSVALDPRKLEGDIRVSKSGGIIFARSRDPSSNTEVAGFFGGGSFNANASLSLIGRLCAARPWAGGIIGAIIPPSFFDGLCRRGGYVVGFAPVQLVSGVKRGGLIKAEQEQKKTLPDTSSSVEADVDIWAEPANVRLGTRTYIFWTSNGVVSCKETGPSFTQNSLSGGASTVPLTGKSVFTITCLTSASTTVEDSVTVNLAL